MKAFLNAPTGPWLSVFCWCVFAVLVAAVIMATTQSVDQVVFGR